MKILECPKCKGIVVKCPDCGEFYCKDCLQNLKLVPIEGSFHSVEEAKKYKWK